MPIREFNLTRRRSGVALARSLCRSEWWRVEFPLDRLVRGSLGAFGIALLPSYFAVLLRHSDSMRWYWRCWPLKNCWKPDSFLAPAPAVDFAFAVTGSDFDSRWR